MELSQTLESGAISSLENLAASIRQAIEVVDLPPIDSGRLSEVVKDTSSLLLRIHNLPEGEDTQIWQLWIQEMSAVGGELGNVKETTEKIVEIVTRGVVSDFELEKIRNLSKTLNSQNSTLYQSLSRSPVKLIEADERFEKFSISVTYYNTTRCFQGFALVQASLSSAAPDLNKLIRLEDLEDELGRFRVWSENIGALRKGHSSLEYKLREAPQVHLAILKLLKEMYSCLKEMIAVLSGSRQPYELETPMEIDSLESGSSNTSGSESDTSMSAPDDSSSSGPRTELEQRYLSIVDINDSLYKISRIIRGSALETRGSKALSYKKVDDETGIDLFSKVPIVDEHTGLGMCSFLPAADLAYIIDNIHQLRLEISRQEQAYTVPKDSSHVTLKQNSADPLLLSIEEEDSISNLRRDPLVLRLAQSITTRRQRFQYWARHRSKLGMDADINDLAPPKIGQKDMGQSKSQRQSNVSAPSGSHSKARMLGKTNVLSETTATAVGEMEFNPRLDSSQYSISVASTSRGIDGAKVELPPPPKSCITDRDFECPYCFIICPARYQKPRAWRAHVLRDLLPYMCTFANCTDGDQLYGTKNEWILHEEWNHRRGWRCPEHPATSFRSKGEFESHILDSQHTINHASDIDQVCDAFQIVQVDNRCSCFVCGAVFATSRELQTHLAFHFERFAAFALPHDQEAQEEAWAAGSLSAENCSSEVSVTESLQEKEFGAIDNWDSFLTAAKVADDQIPRSLSFHPPIFNEVICDIYRIKELGKCRIGVNSDEERDLINDGIVALQRVQNEFNKLQELGFKAYTDEKREETRKEIDASHSALSKLLSVALPTISPKISSSTLLRIVIAGSGGLARILARALDNMACAFLILSRYASPNLAAEGYQIAVVNYDDQEDLRYSLRGIDIVISTISGVSQINLMDAAAHSGVRRFVPAEFEGSPSHRPNNDPLDHGKRAAIDRLRFWSRHPRHRMPFTIFTCGIFYERFSPGGLAAVNIGGSLGHSVGEYLMDVQNGTAQIVEFHASGQPIYISMTSVYDVARFVTAAMDLGIDNWPTEFRLRGDRRSITEITEWGAAVKGVPSLSIEIIAPGDLQVHLEHATYYQDYARVSRIQELIATEQKRYDFTETTLNQLVTLIDTILALSDRFSTYKTFI
ncbi:hypothetical protein G7Y89_g7224 [Cudoniella acicularis]|uniref:C2H2-type domain-containing protein n=1 Tax=Cudoniella acicularis TaxID=354080 RepID=A0A8H4RLK9_9HELO|nr:hypothetical protein G7Y89_g7224 [Cudoniella acicularis]